MMNYLELGLLLCAQVPGKTNAAGLAYLAQLVQTVPPGWLVDLGTYQGRSAMLLHRAAPNRMVVTIDNYQEGPDAKRKAGPRPSPVKVAKQFAGDLHVHLVKGDTAAVPGFVGNVALVFVDGGHTPQALAADIAAWKPRVVPGGVMAFDDYGSARWPAVTMVVDAEMGDWQRLGVKGSVAAFRR